ncbi:MAG: hypothetical protein R3Y24_05165 [Eubacteriales bacterium]
MIRLKKISKRIVVFLLCFQFVFLIGCGDDEDAEHIEEEVVGTQIIGYVTEAYGNRITIQLSSTSTGNQNEGNQGGSMEGEMPEGEMPEGEMPEGGMPEGEMPEGGMPEGEMPEGRSAEGMSSSNTGDAAVYNMGMTETTTTETLVSKETTSDIVMVQTGMSGGMPDMDSGEMPDMGSGEMPDMESGGMSGMMGDSEEVSLADMYPLSDEFMELTIPIGTAVNQYGMEMTFTQISVESYIQVTLSDENIVLSVDILG